MFKRLRPTLIVVALPACLAAQQPQVVAVDVLEPESFVVPPVGSGTPLLVRVSNINPFLYRYRITVNQTSIAGATPGYFLSAIGLGIKAPALPEPPKPEEFRAQGLLGDPRFTAFDSLPSDRMCNVGADPAIEESAQRARVEVEDGLTQLDRLRSIYLGHAEEAADSVNRTDLRLRRGRDVLLSASSDSATLRAEVVRALADLDSLGGGLLDTVLDLRRAEEEYRSLSRALVTRSSQARATLKDCPGLIFVDASASAAAADTATLRRWWASLDSTRNRAASRADSLRYFAHDRGRYTLTAALPRMREHTRLEIVVERALVSDRGENPSYSGVTAGYVDVGRRWPFQVGVGFGWTSLGDAIWKAVPGEDAEAGPLIRRANHSGRVLPYLWLRTRLGNKLGFLTGVGGNFSDGASADYLFGLSLHGKGSRFGLDVAALLGRKNKLARGLEEDGQLPVGTTAVPVFEVRRWGVVVGIAYTIW